MAVRPERPVSKFRSSLNDVAMDAVEEEMMVNFASFISNFHNRDADGNEAEEAFYEVSLAETLESGHTTLHVSFEDVLQHSEPMAGLLLDEYYKYVSGQRAHHPVARTLSRFTPLAAVAVLRCWWQVRLGPPPCRAARGEEPVASARH